LRKLSRMCSCNGTSYILQKSTQVVDNGISILEE
jgi:hypothetical protein